MRKNKRLSKNGFSLIELIIVLAVMAIIALIAIPNFTAVRDSSRNKADKQSMEVINRILLVAETEIELPRNAVIDMHYEEDDKLYFQCTEGVSDNVQNYLLDQFIEVKRPQGKSTAFIKEENEKATSYHIYIDSDGNIAVDTFKSEISQD